MHPLQLREQEIFETLKKIRKFHFVIIGGYAVNAYALPRFSVDCDLVVKNNKEAKNIEGILTTLGYLKISMNKKESLYNNFERFEKDLGNKFRVSIDLLIKEVLDRQTNVVFSADWIFDNSKIRTAKGKTITEELNVNII